MKMIASEWFSVQCFVGMEIGFINNIQGRKLFLCQNNYYGRQNNPL